VPFGGGGERTDVLDEAASTLLSKTISTTSLDRPDSSNWRTIADLMDRGMTPKEAERVARRKFGNRH